MVAHRLCAVLNIYVYCVYTVHIMIIQKAEKLAFIMRVVSSLQVCIKTTANDILLLSKPKKLQLILMEKEPSLKK